MCEVADGTCPIWEESTPLARKPHACMACDETIRRGQRYHRVDCMYDGCWDHWVHCMRCWAMFCAIDSRLHAIGEHDIAVDPYLNCGERWEDPPDEVASLAFALPSDFSEIGVS